MSEIRTGSDGPTGETGSPMQPPVAPAPPRRSRRVRIAGFVAAGLLVGALGVTVLHGGDNSASASSTTAAAASAVPDDGQDDAGPGPGGALAGETLASGTVRAVSSSSITITGSSGATATYTVNGSTEVARDGTAIAVTDLASGESVVVHVLSDNTAERVLAGAYGTRGWGDGAAPPTSQAPDGSATTTGSPI